MLKLQPCDTTPLWDAVKYWVSIINSRGEWMSEQRSYFAAFDSEQGTGVTNNNGYVPSAALCSEPWHTIPVTGTRSSKWSSFLMLLITLTYNYYAFPKCPQTISLFTEKYLIRILCLSCLLQTCLVLNSLTKSWQWIIWITREKP